MEWHEVDQHPGWGCCQSCLEDVAFDSFYAVGDYLCCCRSLVDCEDDSPEGVVAFGARSASHDSEVHDGGAA